MHEKSFEVSKAMSLGVLDSLRDIWHFGLAIFDEEVESVKCFIGDLAFLNLDFNWLRCQ